ncbi:MAG: hypothetical protein QME64_11730, partial [bacterium]|nr:hypothetical protein [bacterium]
SGDLFSQDAYFAMQWDMPSITGLSNTGLAMSAYDGRYARYQSQVQARSPAVDKGAVRITPASIAGTNSDVTCSNFASLGWTNSEDTIDNNRDCQTTIRYIPATVTTHIDPISRLDLGYHYKNGVEYIAEVFGQVTVRYDGRWITLDMLNMFNPDWERVGRDIASSGFSPDSIDHDTIVVYEAVGEITTVTNNTVYHEGFYYVPAYHVYHTPIVRAISNGFRTELKRGDWGYPVGIRNLDLASSPTDRKIYAGIAHHQLLYDNQENYELTNYIDIYGYNPASYTWTKIGGYTYSNPQNRIDNSLHDITIAADPSYIWICWLEWVEGIDGHWELRAARIPNSGYTDFSNSYSRLRNPWNPPPYLPDNSALSLTYDPENASNQPVRLLFLENLPSQLRASPLKWVADPPCIEFARPPTGVPVSAEGEAAGGTPRIVYNPNRSGTSGPSAYRVFAADWQYAWEAEGWLRAYDLTDPQNEVWAPDNAFLSGVYQTHANHIDLSYTASGTKMVVWREIGETYHRIVSNRGWIKSLRSGGWALPRLTTNYQNKRDLFMSWCDLYNLDADPEDEQAVWIKELYP